MKKILLSLALAGFIGTSFAGECSTNSGTCGSVATDLSTLYAAKGGPVIASQSEAALGTVARELGSQAMVTPMPDQSGWFMMSYRVPTGAFEPSKKDVQAALDDFPLQLEKLHVSNFKVGLYWRPGSTAKADAAQFSADYQGTKAATAKPLGAGYIIGSGCHCFACTASNPC